MRCDWQDSNHRSSKSFRFCKYITDFLKRYCSPERKSEPHAAHDTQFADHCSSTIIKKQTKTSNIRYTINKKCIEYHSYGNNRLGITTSSLMWFWNVGSYLDLTSCQTDSFIGSCLLGANGSHFYGVASLLFIHFSSFLLLQKLFWLLIYNLSAF